VTSWFQAFTFKFNVYRYSPDASESGHTLMMSALVDLLLLADTDAFVGHFLSNLSRRGCTTQIQLAHTYVLCGTTIQRISSTR
jgi:hypothetical protein